MSFKSEVDRVKDGEICEQTIDHLEQARKHLIDPPNDSDRNEAMRDCLSAMESMLKTLSGKPDIRSATTALCDTKSWGPDVIVKDGVSLWHQMRDLYPNIRHGDTEKSNITHEEALYWVERIIGFIRYLVRVYKRG